MTTVSKIALVSGAALAAAGCATMTPEAACDRACLVDVTDAYVASFVAQDPTQAPLADAITIVENVTPIEPGDGLWDAVTEGPSTFQIYVPDPVAQTAGYLGVMSTAEGQVLVALRLQLDGRAIVEAEHLVTNALSENNLATLETPRPGLIAVVPEDERMSRDALMSIGASYYDALDDNDGSLSPFADDCERHENGMITVRPGPPPADLDPDSFGYFGALGCGPQLSTNLMGYIDSLDNRRMFAADPVTGLSMGLSHFRHAMESDTIEIRNVPGVTEREVAFDAFDLPAAHVYKITDGEIHEIEAMGFAAPYNSPTGWE